MVIHGKKYSIFQVIQSKSTHENYHVQQQREEIQTSVSQTINCFPRPDISNTYLFTLDFLAYSVK